MLLKSLTVKSSIWSPLHRLLPFLLSVLLSSSVHCRWIQGFHMCWVSTLSLSYILALKTKCVVRQVNLLGLLSKFLCPWKASNFQPRFLHLPVLGSLLLCLILGFSLLKWDQWTKLQRKGKQCSDGMEWMSFCIRVVLNSPGKEFISWQSVCSLQNSYSTPLKSSFSKPWSMLAQLWDAFTFALWPVYIAKSS